MNGPGKILVVDDEPDALENCRRILTRHRYDCFVEPDASRAIGVIEREHPRLVLTDLRMPALDGISLLKKIKRVDPAIQVVLLTAYASIQTAVTSMRCGAFDYLVKPYTSAELEGVVRRAFGEIDSVAEPVRSSLAVGGQGPTRGPSRAMLKEIVGTSPAICAVRELVARVAPTEAAALITGEGGTGKECIARAIHARSARARRAFAPLDCLAATEAALETELFGCEPQPSSGVSGATLGLFELAAGGTLFLDEVGGLSLRLQAKLLRALKEQRFRKVGGSRFLPVDVRVIASSTQDLSRAAGAGEFRQDLLAYLTVIPITLPPLRARREDIVLLAQDFLQSFLRRKRQVPPQEGVVSLEAMALLHRYAWPGNVRELQHVIERAAALSESAVIHVEHLPERLHHL
ncbi:MAG: sigma-54-dependent Fis family transcriptional regulator [Nitrospira sp.]|nr:sigma-54-dependent Fis family transcriptional regulator [Nitrospira sp.]